MFTRLARWAPTATNAASKFPSLAFGGEVFDPVPAGDSHAERGDALDFVVQHVAREPVVRDAVAHHPAGFGAGVADFDLVASPGQVVGGRQSAGSGADDQHPLTRRLRRGRELPSVLAGCIAEKPLDGMDGDRRVEIGAVADRLARVIADPSVDRRKRVVGDEESPSLLVLADPGVAEPALDVLAGRACVVARWQQVDVDGTALADGPGTRPPMDQIR